MDFWRVVRTILEKSPKVKSKELRSKIRQKTGLSESTIYANLFSLSLKGRIIRKKGWYSLPKPATLAHSKQLSIGFEAILAEDWHLYQPKDQSKLALPFREKIESKGVALKDFAVEHLESGYTGTYAKFREWQKKKKQVEEALRKEGTSRGIAETGVHVSGFFGKPVWSEPTQKLLKKRVQAYKSLAGDIELILLKIEARERLEGYCKLCSRS